MLYRDKDWLYQKYWVEKLDAPKIAKICNSHHATIYAWMNRYGIKTRNRSEAQKGKKKPPILPDVRKKISKALSEWNKKLLVPQPYHSKKWLYQKYVNEELSSFAIGKLCNTYEAKIWYWIKKHNIPTRSRSKAVKTFHLKNPEFVALENNPNWKKTMSKKQREMISKKCKENWTDPDYIKRTLTQTSVRPTKPESTLDALTEKDVKYVGNGAFWITLPNGKHKNPDFKITGQRKLIEVFGDYWHRGESTKDLINTYKGVGYDCLVFWESEIYNSPQYVRNKIDEFINGGINEQ